MLDSCRWLALEVKRPDRVGEFYEEHLSVSVVSDADRERILDVGGESELRLRRPDGVPRGGLHTHYALSCPADAYDRWWGRLSEDFELQEIDFGSMRSLYFYDPVGNCVEIGGRDDVRGLEAPTLSGIFEVVFEVESLPEAEAFYTDLGFDVARHGDVDHEHGAVAALLERVLDGALAEDGQRAGRGGRHRIDKAAHHRGRHRGRSDCRLLPPPAQVIGSAPRGA